MRDAPVEVRPGPVIAVLVAGGFAVSLMQTLVVPLLPRFPALLDASAADVTWLVTATLLAGAVFTPVLSRLADLHGRRRVLLVALGLMSLGSAVGAVAPSLGVLVAGRALQGASLAVVAIGTSLMRDVLPPGRLIGGVAVMSSSLGFGGAVGLPLSGLVAQFADWRWLFAGPAVVGVALVVVTHRVVPEPPGRATGRFDVGSALLLGAALLCLLLGISKGGEWGWGSVRVLGLLAGAAVLLPAWTWLTLRASSPLVDLRVTASRPVLLTNLVSLITGFALYIGFLCTPQVLQADVGTGYGLGLPVALAGLALLPLGVTMTLFSPVAAMVSRRFGAPTSLALGSLLLGAGCLVMVGLPGSVAVVVACTVVTSIGTSLALSAMPVLVMAGVPATQTSAANGVNALVRVIGTSSCSAFVAVVVSVFTLGSGAPSREAFVVAYAAGAGAGVLAAVLAVVLVRTSRTARPVPAG